MNFSIIEAERHHATFLASLLLVAFGIACLAFALLRYHRPMLVLPITFVGYTLMLIACLWRHTRDEF